MEIMILLIVAGIGIGIVGTLTIVNLASKWTSPKLAQAKPVTQASQFGAPVLAIRPPNWGWMAGFGVKPRDMCKVEQMAVAHSEPVFLDELNPGLAKSLKALQADGRVTGIEASRFVAGHEPLQPGHVLVYFTHTRQTFADRAFVVRANQLKPM